MSEKAEDLHELSLDDLLALLSSPDEGAEVREELIRRAMPLIEEVVETSFSNSGFPKEELFRPGYLGLLNAVHNYDLARGKSFSEYALNLIKGEIRQYIRDRVKRAKIPAWMKDLNRQIEGAEARLLREKGRLPTLSELAETVNIAEEGIAEIFKAREALSYVSLDAGQRENDPIPQIDISKIRSEHPVPFPIEYRIRIASALERLAELQQDLFRALFSERK